MKIQACLSLLALSYVIIASMYITKESHMGYKAVITSELFSFQAYFHEEM